MTNPLANIQQQQQLVPKTTMRTVIIVPEACHLMIDAAAAGVVAGARFVRIGEDGNIKPLAIQNIQTTTIPVADSVLAATDAAYYQKLKEKSNGPQQ